MSNTHEIGKVKYDDCCVAVDCKSCCFAPEITKTETEGVGASKKDNKMNWKKITKEIPAFNTDVLVCFDNGVCVVACYENDKDMDVSPCWWTPGHLYAINNTDMWCDIVLPEGADYH